MSDKDLQIKKLEELNEFVRKRIKGAASSSSVTAVVNAKALFRALSRFHKVSPYDTPE